ncbi:dihydrofolate reductase family protein [Sphingobacterium paludis]|uniref:Dihydrofolate reductase n=1 Tax=Sphingobacterium paludis TaxID=1476465 RepID=A0A4R7CTJ6_9SPHI|nr:dihydrofolate reductase family protein [Sphingobacterium paludis]TDS11733.1 dihydrofolate reductase [Sphingobacterium paludis]
MRKISLFIATSLDGYIAQPNDNLDFLKLVEKEGEDYGYKEFTDTIDTIIVGRKTYEYVLNEVGPTHYDNGMREVYVMTRTARPAIGRTVFFAGQLTDLIATLRSQDGGGIYCDGGADVINEFLRHDLIDELIVSIVPVLLGSGTRLFQDGNTEKLLQLIQMKTFDTGLAQLHYTRKR